MQLENEYKQRLGEDFDLVFNELFTITNMPISRFGAVLLAKGEYQNYMDLLKTNFSAENLETLMCRTTVSVDWQGNIYDCDFNQMLELPIPDAHFHSCSATSPVSMIASDSLRHLRDLLNIDMQGLPIVVGEHCYGCTAGQGSSCGGALESS